MEINIYVILFSIIYSIIMIIIVTNVIKNNIMMIMTIPVMMNDECESEEEIVEEKSNGGYKEKGSPPFSHYFDKISKMKNQHLRKLQTLKRQRKFLVTNQRKTRKKLY